MKKYKHKITGDIAAMSSNNSSFYLYDGMAIHARIVEGSNDWEEVIEMPEKDYEILSFKSSRGYYSLDPILNCYALGVDCYPKLYLGYMLERPHIYAIHAVKRLSDGEIFQIGDRITVRSNPGLGILTIDVLKLWKDKSGEYMGMADISIEYMEKARTPLFKTEDGIDVFEDSSVYCVGTRDGHLFLKPVKVIKFTGSRTHLIDFSTLKAAEAYLVLNKPCLSIKDVDTIAKSSTIGIYDDMLKLVKSRLGIKP